LTVLIGTLFLAANTKTAEIERPASILKKQTKTF